MNMNDVAVDAAFEIRISIEIHRENAKELDQFYTNPKVAKAFVEEVDRVYGFHNFDYIIEPSMGEGFIYDFLPKDKRIGLDLEKNHPDCLEGDFLEWEPEKSGIPWNPLFGDRPKILFLGNPPFGRNSKLAIDFFKHAAKFSDVVCFIIPRTWTKYSVQNRLPSDFGLYLSAILPDASFIFKGEPYNVRCVAQAWSRYDPTPLSEEAAEFDWREIDTSIENP